MKISKKNKTRISNILENQKFKALYVVLAYVLLSVKIDVVSDIGKDMFYILVGYVLFKSYKKEDIRLNQPTFGEFRFSYILKGAVAQFVILIVSAILLLIFFPTSDISTSVNQDKLIGSVNDDWLQVIIFTFIAIIVTPILEELVFRRGVLGNAANYANGQWRKNAGKIIRILFAILLFPFMHVIAEFIQMFNEEGSFKAFLSSIVLYLPTSIALTYMYLRYKNLWASIALHSLMNTIATISLIVKLYF